MYYVKKINPDSTNPFCVLNCTDTHFGHLIELDMIKWILPKYRVIEVWHDGSKYEYYGIRYTQLLSQITKQPVLYLHTRGAYHLWNTTLSTHRMWKLQFGDDRDYYFDLVKTDKPTVATQFSGDGTTIYNGFVSNSAAWSLIPPIQETSDRYYYERIFRNISKVNVIGRFINDFVDGKSNPGMARLHKYLLDHYKKTDILYVIGKGSKYNNDELRYSLRSLEKYGKNVGRIFIAGYCPDFINKDLITFIPCEDAWECKHKNIINCIETALEESTLDTHFLLSSDDHFYIKETDFNNYPYYRKSEELPGHTEGEEENAYKKTLINTHDLLLSAGLPINLFLWHGNTHLSRIIWKTLQFQYLLEISYHLPGGVEPTCLWLNFLYNKQKDKFKITDRKDVKISKDISKEEFLEKIKDRECFSCASDIAPCVKEFLEKEFPNKSKYEK